MVNVASCNDCLRTNYVCHLSHQFSYWLLVVVAVAAEVVGYKEVNVAFQSLPFSCRLRIA